MSARPIVDQIAHRLADTANWSRKCHGCDGPSSDQSDELLDLRIFERPRAIGNTGWYPTTNDNKAEEAVPPQQDPDQSLVGPCTADCEFGTAPNLPCLRIAQHGQPAEIVPRRNRPATRLPIERLPQKSCGMQAAISVVGAPTKMSVPLRNCHQFEMKKR